MTRYHINNETRRVNICRARSVDTCTANNKNKENLHFDSKEDAHAHIEKIEKLNNNNNLFSTRLNKKLRTNTISESFSEIHPTHAVPERSRRTKSCIDMLAVSPVRSMNEKDAMRHLESMNKELLDMHISAEEMRVLKNYTSYHSEYMNYMIRRGLNMDSAKSAMQFFRMEDNDVSRILKNVVKDCKILDSLIRSAGQSENPRSLFRFVSFSNAKNPMNVLASMKLSRGSIYTDPAFVSTSEDAAFVAGSVFNGRSHRKKDFIVFHMISNKGLSAQLDDQEIVNSLQSFEKERILPRSTEFVVVNAREKFFTVDETREKVIERFGRGSKIPAQKVIVVEMMEKSLYATSGE